MFARSLKRLRGARTRLLSRVTEARKAGRVVNHKAKRVPRKWDWLGLGAYHLLFFQTRSFALLLFFREFFSLEKKERMKVKFTRTYTCLEYAIVKDAPGSCDSTR